MVQKYYPLRMPFTAPVVDMETPPADPTSDKDDTVALYGLWLTGLLRI